MNQFPTIMLNIANRYRHWDTFKSLEKRKYVAKLRTLVEEKEKGAREVRPVVDEILETPSLEHKVIWQYLTVSRLTQVYLLLSLLFRLSSLTLMEVRHPHARSTNSRYVRLSVSS